MSLYGYKLTPTGEAEWGVAYGGSEAHWVARGRDPNRYAWFWVTACGGWLRNSHFSHCGSGPQPRGTWYHGEPVCTECQKRRLTELNQTDRGSQP